METIVIATDFSEPAANAVKYGANLAQFFSARIILLHAFSLPVGGYDSIAPLTVIADLQAASLDALHKTKTDIIASLGYDPGVDCVAEPGSPHGLIAEIVLKRRVDAVVLGIVGNAGAIKKHLIGSTVLDIAREIEVPVFIIPENTSFEKVRKITFALDTHDEETMGLFIAARYFCKVFNASLEIINVESAQPMLNKPIDFAAIEQILRDVDHNLVTLQSDNPAETIEHYFSEHERDLLMLSPKKHNVFQRIFGTGVTKQLVYSLKSPILAFHSSTHE